jgi:membrane protease YdiL (CAAX protease family)
MDARTLEQPVRHHTRLVQRFPVLSFAVLACLFGWLLYVAAAFGLGEPDNLPMGPVAAALIVTACQGRAELRAWGRRLRTWRAAPKWYLLAFLAPFAVQVVIVFVNHLFGAPLPTSAQLAGWPGVLASFVVLVVLIGIGEEAGWMAFAAPILLRRHGFLVAWALATALRISWHLPLMLSGNLPWVLGLVGNAAFATVLLQIFVASGGRWTLAAIWHACLNAVGSGFFFQMVTGADKARLGYLLSGAYVVIAVTVWWRTNHEAPRREGGRLRLW